MAQTHIVHSLAHQSNFIVESNDMSPDQAAPKRVVWSWPILFAILATRKESSMGNEAYTLRYFAFYLLVIPYKKPAMSAYNVWPILPLKQAIWTLIGLLLKE